MRDHRNHLGRETKLLEGINGEVPFNMIKIILEVELQDHIAMLTIVVLQGMNKLLNNNIVIHNTSSFGETSL